MTLVFLTVLALAWMAVLWPALQRARETTPLRSTETFRRGMDSIAPQFAPPPDPTRVAARTAFASAQRRRLRILATLGGASGASLVVAVLRPGALWEVHLAFDAALVIYCVMLIEAKRRRIERRAKVRPLRRPTADPARPVWQEPARAHARRY